MLEAKEMALLGLRVALTAELLRAFLISVEVDWVITRVATKLLPPPLLKLMASPGATSPSRTPTAPLLATLSIFRLTAQAPRSTKAILPLGLASSGSAGVEPEAGQARPTYTTLEVSGELTGAKLRVAVFG